MLIHFIAMNNVQGIESARSHWRIRILLPKIQINILHMSKGKCETGQFWPLIAGTKVARSSEISDRGRFVANLVYLLKIFPKIFFNIFKKECFL